MLTVIAVFLMSACATFPTPSSEDAVLEYTSRFGNYRFQYPATFVVFSERPLEQVAFNVELRGPVRTLDGMEESPYERAGLAVLFATEESGLLDSFESLDVRYRTEWTETQLGGEGAQVLDRSTEDLSSRLVLAHHVGSVFVITMWYPKDNPLAQEDAELIWQIVVESFEYLP